MSQQVCRLAVAAILLAGGTLAGEDEPVKYRLAYRFTPDQQVAYEVVQETEITNQLNGVAEIAGNSTETRRHYRVVSVDQDGGSELEMTIDRVRMTATFNNDPKQTIVFKSDNPMFHHPKFAQILPSIGKPQAIVSVSPAGRTLKVTPTAAANRDPGAQKLDPTASPEGFLAPMPEEPVAIGVFWKERFEIRVLQDKLPIKIEMLRTYKLKGVDDGKATIDFRTTVLTPVEDPEIELQLAQRETQGTIVFDLNEGLVISRDVQVDRTVIGPYDGKGSMRAVSTYKERRISEDLLAEKPEESTIK